MHLVGTLVRTETFVDQLVERRLDPRVDRGLTGLLLGVVRHRAGEKARELSGDTTREPFGLHVEHQVDLVLAPQRLRIGRDESGVVSSERRPSGRSRTAEQQGPETRRYRRRSHTCPRPDVPIGRLYATLDPRRREPRRGHRRSRIRHSKWRDAQGGADDLAHRSVEGAAFTGSRSSSIRGCTPARREA